ncbi:MAG: hypothetical protein CW346_09775 [Bacillaceae bacterium]|nr:hypothetical protein [Bacillaceae bacterium]
MRESLSHIPFHMVKKKPYHTPLPKELEPFHYWIMDCGHSIMCVLTVHLKEALEEGIVLHEVPVPVKYVLEKGYKVHTWIVENDMGDRKIEKFIEVDAPYDNILGVRTPPEYSEW